MKKKLLLALALLALLSPLPAHAQFSAQIQAARGRLKLFTTAALPSACAPGFTVYDTTTDTPKVCQNDGVTFATISGGGGAASSVTSVSGGSLTFTGPTAARVYAIRDANDTIATVGAANTWTAGQVFSASSSFSANLTLNGSVNVSGTNYIDFASDISGTGGIGAFNTLSRPVLIAGTTANAWHLEEVGDYSFNFTNGPCGTSACTDPNFIVHSHNQDTTQYVATAAYGFAGQMVKTLTESSATAVVAIPVVSDQGTGGTLKYTVFASDGTNQQGRSGEVRFAAVAEGTTTTCAVFGVDITATGIAGPTANPDQTEDGSGTGAITSGTLTYGWTKTQGSNLCTLNLNAVSSLTQTTLQIQYRVDLVGPGQPNPQ